MNRNNSGEKGSHMTKMSKAANARPLTFKQQAFVDAYAGDIKTAAIKAGLSYDYARQLITKPHISAAIQQREATEVRPVVIATRLDRQEFWSNTMNDGEHPIRDRLRASELLGKSEGDFIQRLEQVGPRPLKRLEEMTEAELMYLLGEQQDNDEDTRPRDGLEQ